MKKSGFAVVAGLATALLALSSAKAAPDLGSVSLTGQSVTNANSVLGNIMFNTGAITSPTGVFPSDSTGDVTMNTEVRNWNNPANWNGTQLFASPQVEVNDITGFSSSVGPGPNDALNTVFLSGNASLIINGVDFPATWQASALFQLNGNGTGTSWTGTVTAVPGPIVGAGLPGLIAALGGLVAMARRRRKQLA